GMRTRWVALAGACLVAAGFAACAPPASAQVEGTTNPIALENQRPGDSGWRLRWAAAPGELEAYAGAASVAAGEAIAIHVRADAERAARWRLYRMGWYGGAEGRLVASGGPVPVGPRPVPAPDPITGLVACDWPVTFTIPTDPAWTTGIYLLKLVREDGPETWATFVVRDDRRKGAAVYQQPVTTYQAYNPYGGTSLYVGGGKEASFDRPYAEGRGAGQYFRYEHDFVKWAESRGLDLVYVTSLDLERDPSLLLGQRLFLSVGHDEYWSRPMREALEAAIASGVSVAFFSANSVYWQVRLEPSRTTGAPARTLVGWKKDARTRDPLRGTPLETSQWRQLGEPENALLGVMYATWQIADAPWVVRNADAWVYEGTGLAEGDTLPLLVGYESDRTWNNGAAPPGLTVLSRSPVIGTDGRPDRHEAVTYETAAGGFVLAVGTIQWSWGLSR
ncbi:MAG TPA: N,N-dimethylformamidase beta subunit family domain-containing protein, partial [Anaeromyxobacteraceae bacterium]|nr:N,N-dimethylformamidase beta subunit family domain-containing protein [Anaeromyxobacteraceae bacterium]